MNDNKGKCCVWRDVRIGEMGAGIVRIKLRLEEGCVLSEDQVKEGSGQCWMVVGPHLPAIADMASHIVCSFSLQNSCPHGISLYMDNYLLPPAESTCVLKDEDIVSVKKRGGGSDMVVNSLTTNLHAIEGERKVVTTGVKLLAIDEFEKETGGYQSEEEDIFETRDGDIGNANADISTYLTCKKSFKKKRKFFERGIDDNPTHMARGSNVIKSRKKARKFERRQKTEEDGSNDSVRRVLEGPGRNFEMLKEKDLETKEIAGKHAQSDKITCKVSGKSKTRELPPDGCELQRERQHSKIPCQDAQFGVRSTELVKVPVREMSKKKRTAEHNICLGSMKNAAKILNNHKTGCIAKWKLIVPKKRTGRVREDAKDNNRKEEGVKDQQSKGADMAVENPATDFQSEKEMGANITNSVHEQEVSPLLKSTQQGPRNEPGSGIEKDDPTEGKLKKRPSRSSLRKKAKRRWRHEHANAQLKLEKENSGKGSQLIKKDDIKRCSLLKGLKTLSTDKDEEEDIEAEEEILPVIVRPGHIRFGSYDGSEDDVQAKESMPVFCWKDGISKRKGQRWGQQGSLEKSVGTKAEKMAEKECLENSRAAISQKISLDQLPCLNKTPTEADVLSYRMLELTSSWCPELSDYRVGKVVSYDCSSNTIRLAPVPGYPFEVHASDSHDGVYNADSFYDEDGSLEVDFGSLLDVRLVNSIKNLDIMERPQVQENPNVSSLVKGSSFAMHFTVEASEDGEYMDHRSLAGGLKMGKDVLSEAIVPLACSTISPQGIDSNLASAWQELSGALQKKKEELLEKHEHVLHERPNIKLKENVRSSSMSSKEEEKAKTEKVQRRPCAQRSLRAAALGPTINFLRAQDAL